MDFGQVCQNLLRQMKFLACLPKGLGKYPPRSMRVIEICCTHAAEGAACDTDSLQPLNSIPSQSLGGSALKNLLHVVCATAATLAICGCNGQETAKPPATDEFALSPPSASLAEKQAQLEKIRAETARLKAANDAMRDRTPEGRAARLQEEADAQARADKAKAEQELADAALYTWRYEAKPDLMTGTQTRLAFLTSTNQLEFASPYEGGSRGDLMIRYRKSDGLKVLFGISKGQIVCPVTCTVRVRFDQRAPMTFTAAPPQDHSATSVFLSPAQKFVSELAKAKRTLVEITYYQAGSQASEFNTDGLVWEAKPGG